MQKIKAILTLLFVVVPAFIAIGLMRIICHNKYIYDFVHNDRAINKAGKPTVKQLREYLRATTDTGQG